MCPLPHPGRCLVHVGTAPSPPWVSTGYIVITAALLASLYRDKQAEVRFSLSTRHLDSSRCLTNVRGMNK